jgi:hypothetical protein
LTRTAGSDARAAPAKPSLDELLFFGRRAPTEDCVMKLWLYSFPAILCGGALVSGAACSSGPQLNILSAGGGYQSVTTPGVWVRGDLVPEYALADTTTGQFDQLGVNVGVSNGALSLKGLDPTDYAPIPPATTQFSQLQQESVIADMIGQDDKLGAAPQIIRTADQSIAGTIPMRGKPSDVKFINGGVFNGINDLELFVPMGGTFEAPWNQIAILTPSTGTQLNLTVGLKPERVAIHPDGLVFVCNQYSDYISVIDPTVGQVITELPTEYFCSDILFAPTDVSAPNKDDQFMFVANRWRHSVIKYHVVVQHPGQGINQVSLADPPINPGTGQLDPNLAFLGIETFGVGPNPRRLALSEQQNEVYVANGAGGFVALVDIGPKGQPDTVHAIARDPQGNPGFGATAMDIVNVNSVVYMPSSMIDRGLLVQPTGSQPIPDALAGGKAVSATGIDGQSHIVNKGPLFDNTVAYNFEDVRNGLYQLDSLLNGSNAFYYTDDISPEITYGGDEKILRGGLGMAIAKSADESLVFVANAGNDNVQAFSVNTSVQGPTLTQATGFGPQNGLYATGHIPYGLAFNPVLGPKGQLYVADWGGEQVDIIDVASGTTTSIPLEFNQPAYPATNIERGEFNFVNEAWSNNGRKSCASCHEDWQWGADGLSFDNGAASPVTEHRVKMNANIGDTGAYFWNGSFLDNNYASLAFDAQVKDNCRLIEFGIVEGIGSDPAARQGDPKNVSFNANDLATCRPVDFPNNSFNGQDVQGFVQQEAELAKASQAEQAVIAQNIQTVTQITSISQQGVTFANINAQQAREELNREIDIYSVSNLRLPPNPEAFLYATGDPKSGGQLSSTDYASVQNGLHIFNGDQTAAGIPNAGCTTCHGTTKLDRLGFAIYADNLDHGPGAGWNQAFFDEYKNDPRLVGQNGAAVPVFTAGDFTVNSLVGSFPDPFLAVLTLGYPTTEDRIINTYADTIDYFIPFCFDQHNCLVFNDPLGHETGDVSSNPSFAEESRDLALILQFNLGNTDRQFNPGLLVGSSKNAASNTASLRGVWTQSNYLHHGYARSIREAILGPGHPALQAGEIGYAYDANAPQGQELDCHGTTSNLTVQQVNDLVNFVQTIQ